MDIFLEQIVKKKTTTLDALNRAAIIIALVLCVFFFTFIFPVALAPFLGQMGTTICVFIDAALTFGAYYLINNTRIEYEYILTNGELDIDKIIAKRKRKRLITLHAKSISEFGLYNPDHQYDSQMTRVLACSSMFDANTYYAIANHGKYGKIMLVFNPNEKILTHLTPYIQKNTRTAGNN